MNADHADLVARARKMVDRAERVDANTPADMTARQLLAAAKLLGAMAEMLGEVLIEMTDQVGEDNLIIGHETDYNAAPWVKKFMSQQNTVLDYKTYFGEFIDLDTAFAI